MKSALNWLMLGGLWVVTVILLGALARVSWFFLNVGWGMLP